MEQGLEPPSRRFKCAHSSKLRKIEKALKSAFSLLIRFMGLKKMAPACSSLLLVILIGLITIPSVNITYMDQVAYADVVGIDEEFLFLEGEFISKPYVPTSDTVRKEVVEYKVKVGDNISSIASQFGITTNTILWANNIYNPDNIKPGQTLKILPVTGLLYKIKKGDTLEKIAKKYEISADIILHQNELDPEEGLIAGAELVLPGAHQPKPARSLYVSTGRDYGPMEVTGKPITEIESSSSPLVI